MSTNPHQKRKNRKNGKKITKAKEMKESNHYGPKTFFSKISSNLICYMSEYFTLNDSLKFKFLSKKFFTKIENNKSFKIFSSIIKDLVSRKIFNLKRILSILEDDESILELFKNQENSSIEENIFISLLLWSKYEEEFDLYEVAYHKYFSKVCSLDKRLRILTEFLANEECSVTKLMLSDFLTNQKGVEFITNIITLQRKIPSFYFSALDFSAENLSAFFHSIKNSKVIRELRVGFAYKFNKTASENIIKFFESIEKNNSIERFDLHIGKELRKKHLKPMQAMFTNNKSIKDIVLRVKSGLNYKDVTANTNIEVLETGGLINVRNLSDSLNFENKTCLCKLNTLILRGIPEGIDGLHPEFLAEIANNNPHIQHMKFINVWFKDEVYEKLAEILKNKNNIKTLEFKIIHFVKFAKSSGFAAIQDALEDNTSIEKIKLILPDNNEDPLLIEEDDFEDRKYIQKITYRKRDKIVLKIKRKFYD